MQMSFLDFLQSLTDVLKSSIILNHSLHSLPLRLMLTHKAFPKNSRWRYWIWSVASKSRSTWIWVFLISTIFFRKKVSKISSLMAMFGCTYVCEQFFSSMKINKSALWSSLTSKRLNATLQLANTRDFKTNVDSLVSAKLAARVSRRREKIWSSKLLLITAFTAFCRLWKQCSPPTEWYLAMWPAPPNEFETPVLQYNQCND